MLELDGRVAGYGDVVVGGGEVALDVAAPGRWEIFFEWGEGCARQEGVARVRAFFPAGHELAGVAERRGYRLWRSAYTMEVELDDAEPEVPRLPDGIALRTYRKQDAETLRAALNEAFADDPFFTEATPSSFLSFYRHARGFVPSAWLLAWDGDELAGFALAFAERAGEPDLGWVQSLGVRPAWRHRGIGAALLRAAFRALHAHGLRRVGLGVDTANATGALRLYERAGMRAVRRGDNWILEL